MALRQATAELMPSIPDRPAKRDAQGLEIRPVHRVHVVGAGLSGLACALAAARAGALVEVFEAHAGAPVMPMHVNVVPGMLRGLAALGVAEAVVRRGFPYRCTQVVGADGRVSFELAGSRLAGERLPAMLGIGYDQLMAVLLDAARDAGVALHFNCPWEGIAGVGSQADGGSDLVVLATGGGQTVTRRLFPHAPERAGIGQRWWRAVVPRPATLLDALLVFGHDGDKAGAIPMHMTRAGVFLLQRDDGSALPPPQERAACLRAALSRCRGLLREMASLLDDACPVTVEPVRHACMDAPWHDGRLVAVGDAAHLLTPQFGQNGTQAVEDAVVLKDLLEQGLPRDELPAAFTQRRAARVREAHDICLQAARWDLHPSAATDLQALWTRLGQLSACEP